MSQFQWPNSRTRFVATTNLIFDECVPDIFRNSGRGKNIVLTFRRSLGTDTIVESVPSIPDQPESAGGKLGRRWVELDSNNPLKQLHPALVLVFNPCWIFVVIL